MTTLQMVGFVLLWIVIIAEGTLLFLLYRHVGLIYARSSGGLAVGTQAPDLLATGADGRTRSMADLLTADDSILVFGSPTCPGCQALLQDAGLRRFLASRSISGYFLTRSTTRGHSAATSLNYSPSLDVLTVNPETFKEYAVTTTPFAYVVTRTGTIVARGAAAEPRHLRDLCDQARRSDRSATQTQEDARGVPAQQASR